MTVVMSAQVFCYQLRHHGKFGSFKGNKNDQTLASFNMDWFSVNWYFLEKLTYNQHDKFNTTLFYGLYFISGTLKTNLATVKWKVHLLLRSFYSSARWADYINWTGGELFPKKFCSIWWVGNVDVSQTAWVVFASISIAKKLPATFTVIMKEVCRDELMPAKTSFFSSVASVLEPFLRRFQNNVPMGPFISNNVPMGPFLYTDVLNIIEILVKSFIRNNITAEVKTVKTITERSRVDIRVAANSFLAKNQCPSTRQKNIQNWLS